MSASEAIPYPEAEEPTNNSDLVEAQLQQELRSMFEVDTQKYLQTYLDIVEALKAPSWKTDIQAIYRSIHTIKGGAVTVGAEAILQVATVLEDLLSDLRYLDPAPPLEDCQLQQMLLEAGELLASTISLPEEENTTAAPTVQRIRVLHEQIQNNYFPEANEQQRLQHEFVEHGFDLVILDLEMAIEKLPATGTVQSSTVDLARQLVRQLQQIGQDLEFASGWLELLAKSKILFTRKENEFWRSGWFVLFDALKNCAKQGGKSIDFDWSSVELSSASLHRDTKDGLISTERVEKEQSNLTLAFDLLDEFDSIEDDSFDKAAELTQDNTISLELDAINSLDFDEAAELTQANTISLELDAINSLDFDEAAKLTQENTISLELDAINSLDFDEAAELTQENTISLELDDINIAGELLDQISPSTSLELDDINLAGELLDQISPPAEVKLEQPKKEIEKTSVSKKVEQSSSAIEAKQPNKNTYIENIQIPVPLERLDLSAKYLIETLLNTRTTQSFYQNIQSYLTQLVDIAREGVEQITRLRQLQDDYALLNNFDSNPIDESGPTPERYRQGYTIVNRLLEMNLRLAELGAEAEKTAKQTTESLQNLETNVLRLQQTVEDSRLVPFRNLTFRAKAILRDLTNRYGKPAQLVVKGEKIELEVGVARTLEPALLHLIRNAYDHGLESAEERIAKGKPERGTINLSLKRRGNYYTLDLQDDGGGIDPSSIEAKAKTMGLPLTKTQTSEQLLAVICQPGFSSQSQVSDISGRGVGMDVVANRVACLGGKISLNTSVGKGTTFRFNFPVPHLLVPCLLLKTADRTLAIPTEEIATATILDKLKTTQIKESNYLYSWIIEAETNSVPGYDLIEYFYPSSRGRLLDETAICLYIRSPKDSQKGVWLMADELLEQSDLLVKPIPEPLISPEGLMGVSLIADGSLIPVLEATILAERLLDSPCKTEVKVRSSEPNQEKNPHERTILVIDDAALVRRRIEASLAAYGYIIRTFNDGMEAWNWLQTNPRPDLIITDIEMPNMDGFSLISHCRETGINIPILVISSRLSEEWGKEASRLGATDYLTKGFSTPELISRVNSLLGSLKL